MTQGRLCLGGPGRMGMIGGYLFYIYGTHRPPVATVEAAPAHTVGIEVDVRRVVREDRNERRTPVAAVGTRSAETGVVPATGGGKENTIPVGRCYQSTVDSAAIVVRYPSPGTRCL